MNRKQFITTTLCASAGIALIPHITMAATSNDYTRNQLIGKGNPELTGSTYLTTMHQETAAAFAKMKAAAAQDNIAIEVVSAYRSFQRQKEIFERKYTEFTNNGLDPLDTIEKIIEYSTLPGTSRHHWGTDLDIIDANGRPRPRSVLQAKHFHGNGPFCKLKEWLNVYASDFGFYEVYTNNAQRKGFNYEPWHMSYAPVSKPMLQGYKALDVGEILREEQVLGNAYFTADFIERYRREHILDINPELL
ncbi:M15 family metallopeptidase [Altibacter sp. HG106]|uniref:M15 family metallopeptidase n=1 Tax=Altibacter sp. HG106 TaxID=3023937 RepID=UPI0023501028|nr:M15 family metallopeptidase [Altibacter sp. HG106]MDC7995885.1 M15 family metallopeptidase [Altibacter sp. HG106]